MLNSETAANPRNVNGQAMRRKGQQTRQRLVQATAELLKRESLASLRAADIAAQSGSSKPNFYLYFPSVLDAALAAVESVAMDTPLLLAVLEEPWSDEQVLKKSRAYVSAYFRHWQAHSHVLRVRRAMVGEGDARFIAAEAAALMPLVSALARKIKTAQQQHPALRRVHPPSAAGAVAAMLERLAGRGPMQANGLGISNGKIVTAIATTIANLLVPQAETRRGTSSRKPHSLA